MISIETKRKALVVAGSAFALMAAGCEGAEGSLLDTILPVIGSALVSWLVGMLIPV